MWWVCTGTQVHHAQTVRASGLALARGTFPVCSGCAADVCHDGAECPCPECPHAVCADCGRACTGVIHTLYVCLPVRHCGSACLIPEV